MVLSAFSDVARRMLFPSVELMDPRHKNVRLTRLKDRGAYESRSELYDIHIQLLREDFLCALSEQIEEIRKEPDLLDGSSCYCVVGHKIKTKLLGGGRYEKQLGVEFRFDPTKYTEVEWHEDKRLMRNNLVLLTKVCVKLFSFLAPLLFLLGVIVQSMDTEIEVSESVTFLHKNREKVNRFSSH